jgi:dienelactone hydrolase
MKNFLILPLLFMLSSCAAGQVASTPAPVYQAREFEVPVEGRKIAAHLFSPAPDKLAKKPLLLLTFAMDWKTSLDVEPYNGTAQEFLKQGHRVLSFDLPNHGARIDRYGEGIRGMRNAFVAGHDPFAAFLQDASAVIDRCIAEGLVVPGRIMVCGTSRAGYLALRLLAADSRVAGAAAYAPVTDWRELTEFAADKNRTDVAALALSNFADRFAGKPVFFMIGNHDTRVGTASCCRFYLEVAAANVRHGFDDAALNFQVQDTPGHSSQNSWYKAGAAFLLRIGQN